MHAQASGDMAVQTLKGHTRLRDVPDVPDVTNVPGTTRHVVFLEPLNSCFSTSKLRTHVIVKAWPLTLVGLTPSPNPNWPYL